MAIRACASAPQHNKQHGKVLGEEIIILYIEHCAAIARHKLSH